MNATRESETAHAHLCDRDEQHRETIAKAINPRPWSERFIPFRCHGDDRTTEQLIEEERDRVRQTADAVLAVLHTRTVAQVKAEALREYRASLIAKQIDTFGIVLPDVNEIVDDLDARADELEREDKR